MLAIDCPGVVRFKSRQEFAQLPPDEIREGEEDGDEHGESGENVSVRIIR